MDTINRRTAVKLIGAGAVGTALLPGQAIARPDRGRGAGPRSVLDIVGRHEHDAAQHVFDLSASAIPSGWTTLNFDNQTEHTHFVYPVKLPNAEANLSGFEGDTLRERYMNAVTFPFQAAWDPYYAGDANVGEFFTNLVNSLPGWFFTDVIPVGGPGLTAGGEDAQTTVNLTPGTYFLECYVLDDEGVFHSAHGMLESLTVTETASKMAEPEASLDVAISTTDGILFPHDDIELGRHTIGVTFDDNQAYGNGLLHDVHLIRLADGTTYADVNDWMDYLDVGSDGFYADDGALTSAHGAPGPATFLGGVQDIAPDRANPTAYLEATFSPGDYAWVSEVPNPDDSNLLHRFTVSPPGRP